MSHVGEWSQYFLTAAILLFAFSSIIYNYYLGENALTVFTEGPLSRPILRISIGLRVLTDFTDQLKQGNNLPVFDPAKFSDLDIDRQAWDLKD